MGVAERKEREKAQRRQQIIDAAEKVFARKGYRQATMDDVAREAELSKGTLYLYFNGKYDLYHAIILRGFKQLQQLFSKAIAGADTGIARIEALGLAFLEFHRRHPDYYNAILFYEQEIRDVDENNPMVQACHLEGPKILETVAAALRSGMQDGTIRRDIEPWKTAIFLWSSITGIIHISKFKSKILQKYLHTEPAELINCGFDMIKKALQPR